MAYIFGNLGRSSTIFRDGIRGAKENTFRETRKLFAGRRGDECIIFMDQGSTDPPGGLICPMDSGYIIFKNTVDLDQLAFAS